VPSVLGSADQGRIAWSPDPASCTSNSIGLAFGTFYMIRLALRSVATISNILLNEYLRPRRHPRLGGELRRAPQHRREPPRVQRRPDVQLGDRQQDHPPHRRVRREPDRPPDRWRIRRHPLQRLRHTPPQVVGGSGTPGGGAVNLGQTATPVGLRFAAIAASGYNTLPPSVTMSGLGQPSVGPILVSLS
jgi:hypothetical protein